jgi:glycosyltransferase involved in cell wall biosynthesis
VVDASPDQSWEIVERLAAADHRIAGLLLSRNVGQHAAILAGLSSISARWFLVMDADLQDPPELIPLLVQRARVIGRTVFARRHGIYQRWDRMLTSRLFKTTLQWLTGVPADVGTFFVMDALVAARVRACRVRHPHVVVLAHHLSAAWETVNVERARRPSGRSSYSSWGRLRAAVHAIRCSLECRRAASMETDDPLASLLAVAQRVNL